MNKKAIKKLSKRANEMWSKVEGPTQVLLDSLNIKGGTDLQRIEMLENCVKSRLALSLSALFLIDNTLAALNEGDDDDSANN